MVLSGHNAGYDTAKNREARHDTSTVYQQDIKRGIRMQILFMDNK